MSPHSSPSSRQTGYTLVELMVAVVLALLIAVAIGSVYLGSTQSYRTSTGLSQLQEQDRYVNLLVTPILRQAGYVADPTLTQTDPTTLFTAANNQLAVVGYTTAPTVYPGLGSADILSGTDVVAVSFIGQSAATSTTDSPLRTCLGNPVYSSQVAVNVFYVSATADASGSRSLYCYSNVSTLGAGLAAGTTSKQPLIPGITGMVIRYGIDAKNDGSSVSFYRADSVAAIVNNTTFTNPWIATSPWLAVTAIQIAYTIESTDTVERGSTASGVNASGRLQNTVTETIDIRNRLHN